MQRTPWLLSLLAAISAAPAPHAQVTATYTTFGAGCRGTGSGLGDVHLLPVAAATTWGAGNAIPFGWSPNRFQQVFLGTELPTSFTMASLSLRQPRTGPVAHGFTVDLDIRAGYTTRWTTTLSTTFADNWDVAPPVQVLPRAQMVFPDQSNTPGGDLFEFVVTLPWPIPFAWTPSSGRNLLVEVTIHGNSYNNQIWGYPLDNLGGTVALWGTPANATTGVTRTFGPVMAIRELSHTAVPLLLSREIPLIGDQFPVLLTQARASTFALLFFGVSDTSWNGIPLPLGLGGAGAPGCSVLASAELLDFVRTNGAGNGSFTYDIPNDIYLLRARFYNQFLVADPGANALGFAVSNGGAGVVGNQ